MKFPAAFGLGGIAVIAGTYFLFRPPATELPVTNDRDYVEHSVRSEKESGWAPVQFWSEAAPELKGGPRAQKAARLTLTNAEVFSGDVHLPRESIRGFLDERVAKGEIDYVVIFPNQGSKWKEIIPVLDECRKSRVRVVLLNQY